MLPRSLLPRRPNPRFVLAAAVFASLLRPLPARGEFAEPAESPYRRVDPNRPAPPLTEEHDARVERWESSSPASTFRFHVGPAVLLQPAGPGLFTALDIGERAVGARMSAAWLRAESEQGLSAYSAELWIDFRHRSDLHPVLGAGASFLRGGALGEHDSAGAGLLRCALEYELPIVDADARLSLSAFALVPAIASDRTRPWTMASLTVGAGF